MSKNNTLKDMCCAFVVIFSIFPLIYAGRYILEGLLERKTFEKRHNIKQ